MLDVRVSAIVLGRSYSKMSKIMHYGFKII